MRKPNNYESVQAGGDFTPVELGGHKIVIKGVQEKKTRTDKDMLVVMFDFATGDKQAGYFMDAFKNDLRPDKNWPNAGTQYIVMEDNEGNCTKSFKQFITCLENSNVGFKVDWNKTVEQFKGRLIGGVYGSVEEEYNGEVKKRNKLRWFCDVSKYQDAAIPNPKTLSVSTSVSPSQASMQTDGFSTVEDSEPLPF